MTKLRERTLSATACIGVLAILISSLALGVGPASAVGNVCSAIKAKQRVWGRIVSGLPPVKSYVGSTIDFQATMTQLSRDGRSFLMSVYDTDGLHDGVFYYRVVNGKVTERNSTPSMLGDWNTAINGHDTADFTFATYFTTGRRLYLGPCTVIHAR